MTAAIAMNVPGGRAVVGWWRDLAGRRPRRLWFAHLPLHHLEALVERDAFPAPEILGQALLALCRARPGPIDLTELQEALCLDAGMVDRLIDNLQARGRLTRTGRHIAVLTGEIPEGPAGASQAVPERLRKRCVFHFTAGEAPLFVPLAESACTALMPPASWSFDLALLERCLAQPAAWRRDNDFAPDARRLLRPGDLPEEARADAVAVDRAEQALLVLVQTDEGLLGFPVSPEGWEMQREPALSLPMSADLSLSLLEALPPEQWRQAWQSWCQQRSLPSAEVEACKLEPIDHRLLVRAPGRLVDRLRQARSEVFRGEAWLLAGAGRVRPAAQIELAN